MFLPSLNALALIVIGIVVLITYFVKTRRVSNTEVTIIGVGASSQLIRQRAPVFLALVLIVAGSILSYFQHENAILRPIAMRNIETINAAVKQVEAPDAYTIDKQSFMSTFKSNLDNDVLLKQMTEEVALADNYFYSEGRLWSKDIELELFNGEYEGEISIIVSLMKVYCWDNRFGIELTFLEKTYGDYLLEIFGSKEALNLFIDQSRESKSEAWERYKFENNLSDAAAGRQIRSWMKNWEMGNN